MPTTTPSARCSISRNRAAPAPISASYHPVPSAHVPIVLPSIGSSRALDSDAWRSFRACEGDIFRQEYCNAEVVARYEAKVLQRPLLPALCYYSLSTGRLDVLEQPRSGRDHRPRLAENVPAVDHPQLFLVEAPTIGCVCEYRAEGEPREGVPQFS